MKTFRSNSSLGYIASCSRAHVSQPRLVKTVDSVLSVWTYVYAPPVEIPYRPLAYGEKSLLTYSGIPPVGPGGALQTSLSSAPARRRGWARRNREIFINFVFLLLGGQCTRLRESTGESVDGNVHDDGDEIADGNLLRVHVNLFLPNVMCFYLRLAWYSRKREILAVEIFTRNIFF